MKDEQNLSKAHKPVVTDRFYYGTAPQSSYFCKECKIRYIGCHKDCPDYLEKKAQADRNTKDELKRNYNPGFSKERERKLRKNERDRRNR